MKYTIYIILKYLVNIQLHTIFYTPETIRYCFQLKKTSFGNPVPFFLDSSLSLPFMVLWLNVCDKEHLVLRNNFRVTNKFLISKFDCIWLISFLWTKIKKVHISLLYYLRFAQLNSEFFLRLFTLYFVQCAALNNIAVVVAVLTPQILPPRLDSVKRRARRYITVIPNQ